MTLHCIRAMLICLCLAATGLADSAAGPRVTGVRVGFGGRYRVGLWTPVEVTLHGGDRAHKGQLSVIVPDGGYVVIGGLTTTTGESSRDLTGARRAAASTQMTMILRPRIIRAAPAER